MAGIIRRSSSALAALLARCRYWLALVVWQGVTLMLYMLSIRAILAHPSWPGLSRPSTTSLTASAEDVDARPKAGHDGREGGGANDQLWLLLALAFPAVFVNLGQAHNGFLTAALIGAALVSSNAGRRSPAC